MYRHAAGASDRLKPPFCRQPALVERMASFVQHPHQGAGEIVLAIAGGDADIVRGAAAERVGADIEPTVLEIEPDPFHQDRGDAALGLDRERTRGAAIGDRLAWRASTSSRRSGRRAAISSKRRSIAATEKPGSYWSRSAS